MEMNKAKFHFHTTNVSSRFIIKYSVKGGREMADTQQYDDFIRFLQEKGVLSNIEAS